MSMKPRDSFSEKINKTDKPLTRLTKTERTQQVHVKVKVNSLSPVRLFATLWTVAHQAPPSIGFSRQEYWSGLPLPSPGYLPDPGIKPGSPALEADALTSEPPGKPHCACAHTQINKK